MEKKIVWLISENSGVQCTALGRYHTFAKFLEEKDYNVYVIVGSSETESDIHYISLNGPRMKKIKVDGVKYIVVKRLVYRTSYERVLSSLYFQHNIWKLRDKFPKPYAIVSSLTGLFGNVVFKWKRKYRTKVFFDVFDFWPEAFVQTGQIGRNNIATQIMYKLEHKSYRDANGVIFCVEGGMNYIKDKGWDIESGGDVDVTKFKYINNGTNLRYLDQQIKNERFDDCDLESNKFKVVYIGTISAVNDLDIIVESAKEMQKRVGDKVLFLVYGDGNKVESLEYKAKQYNLINIKFKGRIESKFSPNVISRCDLCFWNFSNFPLLKYGISNNKFFLYVSSGKPVLATFKANYDLVENRKCGMIVKKDAKLVADAIEHFIDMPRKEYEEYCNNSRKVAEDYDYGKTIDKLIDLIEN